MEKDTWVGAVFTLARAELRAKWRGWLVAALLVGLAGGVVLTTVAGARRTDTAYARLLASSRAADAIISPQNTGIPSYYDAVAKLPGVDVVAPTVGLVGMAAGDGNFGMLLDGSTDARLGRIVERPKITDGRMYDPTLKDEAVADRYVAGQFHLHAGSVLHLLVGPSSPAGFDFAHATPVTIRIVGIGVTREDVVPVNALAAQGNLLVTPALIRSVNPDIYAFDGAFVRLKKGATVGDLGRQAQALIPQYPETGGQLFVADEHQQAAQVRHAIHPQAVALALFGLLVGLTALLIIGQVLARQVFVASADHPILRALGLSRAQLAAVGLVEVGVTLAVGAVMALLIGTALSPLTPIGPARIAEPNSGLAVNWAIFGLGALAIVVVFTLRLALPIWRLAGQHTRTEGGMPAGGAERPSRILEVLTLTGAPVSATVGARLALEPGRGRTAVPIRSALAGTTVAVAAVAAAFTFGTNLVRLVNTPRLYGQAWQIAVDAQFGKIAQRDVETFLRQQRGVSGWTFGNHGDAIIAGHDVATIGITRAEGPAMFPTLLEGRAPRAPDEIVLGSKTLSRTHRQLGQTVTVAIQGEDTPRTMRVVGRAVFPFFGKGSFTPTGLGDGAAMLDAGSNPGGYNFVLVGMVHGPAENADTARFAQNLKATGQCPADQGCGAVTTQRPADVNNYARIQGTPRALAGVMALLAVATVTHLLVTSIRRRRRDLAVLKTLGFVRRQVSAAVAWQATIFVALALVVGLPVGVAAGRLTWQFFATRLGVAPDSNVPVLAVLVSIPVALAIANAVAAAPGWVAGRLRPAPVLRTE
jgi:hypothetical protein